MAEFRLPGGDIFAGKSGLALEAELYRQREAQLPITQNWFLSATPILDSGIDVGQTALRWYVLPIFVTTQLRLAGAMVQVIATEAGAFVNGGIYRYIEKGARFDLIPGTSVRMSTASAGNIKSALSKQPTILPSRRPYFIVVGCTSVTTATFASSSNYHAMTDLWLVKAAADTLPATFNAAQLSKGPGSAPISLVYYTVEASRIY